jgi:hypothetical protein
LQANLIMPEPCEFHPPKLAGLFNHSSDRSRTARRHRRYKQLHCRRAFQGTTASVHAANYFSGPPGGRGRQRTPRLIELPGPARRASGRRLSAALFAKASGENTE